jgi:hypothetical protein
MLPTGDGSFRVVVAFAMSDAWEHSHCHMHEHILICPLCYQQHSQLILGAGKPVPTNFGALGWWNCWMNILKQDNVKKQGIRNHSQLL